MPKHDEKKSFLHNPMFWVWGISGLLLLFFLGMSLFDYQPMLPLIPLLLLVIHLICLQYYAWQWVGRRVGKKGLQYALYTVIVVLSAIMFFSALQIGILLSVFTPKPVETYISPDGKHTVLLMDNGYIDTVYVAYPKAGPLFYKYQDNGSVAVQGASAQNFSIEWLSDIQARVQVHYSEETDPQWITGNKDGYIYVNFD